MSYLHRATAAGAVALAGLVPALAAASCGSAFCSVNTSSAFLGRALGGSTRVGLRFEFIDQKQPMHGTDSVGVGELSRHHDEARTLNRNWLASVEHDFGHDWSVALTLPIVDRSHQHIHNHHHDGEVLHIHDSWDFTEIGDLRVLARHELVAGHQQSFGISFGLKLPTGDTGVDNDEGDLAERSLQPGSGTTDLLLGAHYRRELDGGSQAFASISAQIAGKQHDDFRPGHRYHLDLGWQTALSDRLSFPLQLNIAIKERDKGDEAEPEDSGSKTIALSPGLAYQAAPNWLVYGYYQRPIYQDVNGVQLTAHWSAVIGSSYSF